jgi:hypothetical protein
MVATMIWSGHTYVDPIQITQGRPQATSTERERLACPPPPRQGGSQRARTAREASNRRRLEVRRQMARTASRNPGFAPFRAPSPGATFPRVRIPAIVAAKPATQAKAQRSRNSSRVNPSENGDTRSGSGTRTRSMPTTVSTLPCSSAVVVLRPAHRSLRESPSERPRLRAQTPEGLKISGPPRRNPLENWRVRTQASALSPRGGGPLARVNPSDRYDRGPVS